jgi:hypothetical protein
MMNLLVQSLGPRRRRRGNGLQKSADGRGLGVEVRLEVLGDLTDKTLEEQFAGEELGGRRGGADENKNSGGGS